MKQFILRKAMQIAPITYSKIILKKSTGYALNLRNPQTFNDKVSYSEITITPAAGCMPLSPKEADYQLGTMIRL